MENLVAALREAGHRADLVRLPVAWEKGRLFDSPLAWRLVPIDADLVIAMNFPSYFVRHPNKVVWLLHQHRGAYELADSSWSDIGTDTTSLEVQRQLTEWDTRALREARAVFANSGVVSDRLARYNGLASTPLYHPPPLADRLRGGAPEDFVLLPSRLETNKRPDLVLEGFAHASSPARLVLAGSGSLREELEARARALGIADRVELPGFVSDDELVDLFARCAAVVYAPFDEDYGYVTLQAFGAGKPVVTTNDSGGVLEWVEDGVTGIVAEPTPAALGAAIDSVLAAPDRGAALGAAGRARSSSLAWGPVVEALVGAGAPTAT